MELILSLMLAAAVVGPNDISLERVVDQTARPAGVDDSFRIEVLPPVPCGDRVYFEAATDTPDGIRTGLYGAAPGLVESIANTSVPVPGRAGTFQDAGHVACGDDRVHFFGDDDVAPSSSGPGLFTSSQGAVSTLIDVGELIDGRELTASAVVDADQEKVAFLARFVPTSTTQAVAVQRTGTPAFTVADRTTVLPGQSLEVSNYSLPTVMPDSVVFRAATGLELGVYRWRAGEGLSLIADTLTPSSAIGGERFDTFGRMTVLEHGLVFAAAYSAGDALFLEDESGVHPLVRPGDLTASGETLTSATLPSGRGSLLSFNGTTMENPSVESVFVRTSEGEIRRILGQGDEIDGFTVGSVVSGTDHRYVYIRVESTDLSSRVIYRASVASPHDIPGLAPLGLVGFAILLSILGFSVLRQTQAFPKL